MSELFKALANLQAELPKVGKNATAQYGKYADLADVSAVVLPLLGKYGLAFMAKPTMDGGSFGLAYSLVHTSGEREDGFYPLPVNGNSQQLGSAITYARRYSLCAVTGVAPDEDDDGAAAKDVPWQGRPADSDWEHSTPAASRQNGRQQGRASGPAKPATPPVQSADVDAKAVDEWAAKIDEITSADDADRTDADLKEVFTGGRMNSATANAIRKAIKAKRNIVTSREEKGRAAS
jgi:hypothetical protein